MYNAENKKNNLQYAEDWLNINKLDKHLSSFCTAVQIRT